MQRLKDLFSLDLRALALMRIAIASVTLFDLGVRFTDVTAFYSDYGVLPREALIMILGQKDFFSLHLASGEIYFQVTLFLLSFWSHFNVLLGRKTKIYTVLSWFLLLSLQNRNLLIGQAGDDVLRLAMMWGIFLPWNKFYSLDSIGKKYPEDPSFFSFATVGLTFLIFSLYFFSAVMKRAPEWTTDHTAVYYALSLDQLASPFGKWIYPFPTLLKWLSISVYYIEWIGPFLLFIPWRKNLFRLLFVVLFISFHVGLSLTLFIGFFPVIVIAVLLGFLPEKSMSRMHRTLLKIPFRIPKIVSSNDLAAKEIIQVGSNFNGKYVSFFLFLLVVQQLSWNLKSVNWISSDLIPFKTIAYQLRLDQSWGMFAPGVFKEDGWFLFEGITEDDNTIDISRNGQQVRYGKPEQISSMFKNDRWRKYTENLLMIRNQELRPYYAAYLYERWMSQHPEIPIQSVRIIYMKELTLPNYLFSEPRREVLIEWKR